MSKLDQYRARIKYPMYLFLLLLFVKIAYVIVESYYNFHVLNVTTAATLTKETIENLNINGHRISAIGITLLLFPFLYFIAKVFKKYKLVATAVLSVMTYFIAFYSLNMIIDKIVLENKEKRYDAYYVNVFKYGVLNNIFVYDSFIDSRRIQNKAININDRMLLVNTFLLLHADDKLIAKLKDRGREKVADVYIEQNLKEDFIEKREQFYKASHNICYLWNEINKNKIKIRDALSPLEIPTVDKRYATFVNELMNGYSEYKKAWKKVNDRIIFETQDHRLKEIQEKLNKYFKYKKVSKARKKYKEAMIENFGYYLQPHEWNPVNNKVTKERISFIIKREILKQVDQRLKRLPSGLSVKEFMYHYETKYNVMKALKEKDIFVPYEFDYSKKQFKKYFDAMSDKKHSAAYEVFYKKLEEKIGKNDITLSMDYSEFIHSQYIKDEVSSKLCVDNNETVQNIIYALESKDLANFKDIVYLPRISEIIEKMNFDREDFLDNNEACAYGDDAIKLLYIPPFALSISMISLLLNFITVFGMLLIFTNIPNKISQALKIILIVATIFVPIYFKTALVNNNLLQQKSIEAKMYVNFLAWMSFYERQNAFLHEKHIFPDVSKFL